MRQLIVAIAALAAVSLPNSTTYAADNAAPETPAQKDVRMEWWRKARFGMFIHWGLYNVAGNEWNGTRYPPVACRLLQKSEVDKKEYVERLMPRFTATKYNPQALAQLAKRAGMRYAVLTTKHHEGFCLFDTELTEFSAMHAGAGRDVVREYVDAFRKEELKTGFYYSLLDWHHPDFFQSEFPAPADGRTMSRYVDYLHGQARELLTNYGTVDVIWWDYSDATMQGETWRAQELITMTRSLQPDIIMNNRLYAGVENTSGDFATPEQSVPATGLGFDWEACMTINDNWGYALGDHGYKSSIQLIRTLVDIVSKGGNLLLNVGPRADGSIPEPIVERLEAIGRWMNVNSESIYGTQASPFHSLPAELRVSTGPMIDGVTKLYLHVFDWPSSRTILVPPLSNTLRSITLLDGGATLAYTTSPSGTSITLPWQPRHEAATVLVMEIDGKPEQVSIGADENGIYHLEARTAVLHGGTICYPSDAGAQDSIGCWLNTDDWVSWTLRSGTAGRYRMTATAGVAVGNGGTVEFKLVDQILTLQTTSTGGWFERETFDVGEVTLPSDTTLTLEIRTLQKQAAAALDLQCITLTPIKETE